MSRNKQKNERPQEKPFRTATFTALKGIVIPAEKKVADSVVAPKPAPRPVEDDTALFLQAVSGTRLLEAEPESVAISKHNNKVLLNSQQAHVSCDQDEKSLAFLDEIRRLKLEVTFTSQHPNEDELSPLSGNRLRQLKRGIVAVGSQLDLHGLTKDEALFELSRFLRSAQSRNESAVLVITGKGNHSPAEPVLQQTVAAWLRDAGRTLISEFAPAPREMGGSGAFVLFLKKLKTSR